jgi:hypothetical protein
VHDVDTATGEILATLDTGTLPDRVIYTACGDRRASVCPACAETYRRDTYQLIRAGLAGGKGVPESVAIHPAVFATFTAPSFGPVHTRPLTSGGKVARCRPRRRVDYCSSGDLHRRRRASPPRSLDKASRPARQESELGPLLQTTATIGPLAILISSVCAGGAKGTRTPDPLLAKLIRAVLGRVGMAADVGSPF